MCSYIDMSTGDQQNVMTVTVQTLAHYEQNAQAFWQGTRDHDVSRNYTAFLSAMQQDCVLDILDLGCGPGRDVKYFADRGHRVIGLDGCQAFCAMAREYSGAPIVQQSFLALDLAPQSFDGIFANASLFHVPGSELARVLTELHAALKPGGILFTSNPRGSGEGWNGERYGHYMELETSKRFLEQANFALLEHYYRPSGRPRDQQPWLAIVSKKNG